MRKFLMLALIAVLFAAFSVAAEVDLEIEENPDLVAGDSGEAVLNFDYEGDQFGRGFEPFAMVVTVNHSEGSLSNKYFDASGDLRYSWAGNDYSFDLECVGGPEEVSSVNQTGAFYSTSSTVVNESQLLCLPENTLSVLKSNTFIEDGSIELNLSTSARVAPGEMNVTYDFGSFAGFPEFDPLLEADENGTVELEEQGVRAENLSPGSEIGIVGYSSLNVEKKVPGGEARVLSYYGLEPENDTGGKLELDYSIEGSDFESPRLYRCQIREGDCEWQLIETQSSGNGEIIAEVDKFSIFGVFTSREEEVVVETESGGGGGTTVITETETETEYVNNTEVETVLKPTATFDILYTSPDIREDVKFNASNSYDPDGEIESYEWSFGEEGEVTEASFREDRPVNVTLTVTDSQGARDSQTKSLNSEIEENSSEDSTRDSEQQDTSERITGQFLGSPTNIVGILVALFAAMIGVLAYKGRIEVEAIAARIKNKSS